MFSPPGATTHFASRSRCRVSRNSRSHVASPCRPRPAHPAEDSARPEPRLEAKTLDIREVANDVRAPGLEIAHLNSYCSGSSKSNLVFSTDRPGVFSSPLKADCFLSPALKVCPGLAQLGLVHRVLASVPWYCQSRLMPPAAIQHFGSLRIPN